jgi:hypothetical protein
MKYLTLTLLTFFVCARLFSQTDNRSFGNVNKEELLLKNCDFDNNAAAAELFNIGEFYCDIRPWRTSNEQHVRIKIFNDKGLSSANIHIPYFSYNHDEQVTNITAQTYNLDASGNIIITKLDKKTIFDKKINKRYSEIVFTLPEVKPGSVIEYKYSILGSENSTWYFQKSIPVLFSQFTVNFPVELEMQCMPLCTLPYTPVRKNKGGRDIQMFSMEKVPSLHDEAFISCDEDYLQRIETRMIAVDLPGYPRQDLIKTWPGIIKNLMEDYDFGGQLNKNIPRTDSLELMLKNIASPYRKMIIIHEYVRNNMHWNEYDNIWALEGVKSAWKDKKGTSGEINLILVNLLKDAGLNAHPVLVSTRSHGRVNVFMPSTRQFNKVMAYVEIGDKDYVLDATEKFTPSRLIPLDALACEGLVIEKPETFQWGWRTLWNQNEIYKNSVLIFADVDSNGVMSGVANVSSYDHARVERVGKYAEGKENFMKAFYTPTNPELKIDSVAFENEKNDSLPFLQRINFNESLNASGDYKYFTANLFSGLEKNPFLQDNRFSDIFFGYDQQISIIGNITLPPNYILEGLPKNIKMMMPDTGIVFTRLSGINDNTLSMRITVEFKKPVYGIDEYESFKEFYKKMFNLLNEQFVIRKKS